MKQIDWSQNPEHLELASKAIGVPFDGSPVYWLSVVENEKLLAVVIYSGFTVCSCEVSVAVFSTNPFNRGILRKLFAYPFHQLKLRRLHAYTQYHGFKAADQLCRLGFIVEGLVRNWYPDCHGVLHGLLKEECKWL